MQASPAAMAKSRVFIKYLNIGYLYGSMVNVAPNGRTMLHLKQACIYYEFKRKMCQNTGFQLVNPLIMFYICSLCGVHVLDAYRVCCSVLRRIKRFEPSTWQRRRSWRWSQWRQTHQHRHRYKDRAMCRYLCVHMQTNSVGINALQYQPALHMWISTTCFSI